jgi:hypothetical protein
MEIPPDTLSQSIFRLLGTGCANFVPIIGFQTRPSLALITWVTESGNLDTIDDVNSLITSSVYGMGDWCLLMLILAEKGWDATDGTLPPLLLQIAPQLNSIVSRTASADPPYSSVHATMYLLLMYIQGGIAPNTKDSGMIIKAGFNSGTVKNTRDFYALCHRYPIHGYLANVGQSLFFASWENVQAFYDMMGTMTKDWILTHSAAGSAAITRIQALHVALGLPLRGIFKAYFAAMDCGVQLGAVISFLTDSFSQHALEGPCVAAVLYRWAYCLPINYILHTEKAMNGAMAKFIAILVEMTDDAMDKGTSQFSDTLRTDVARKSFADSYTKSSGLLSDQVGIDDVTAKLDGLNSHLIGTSASRPSVDDANALAVLWGCTMSPAELVDRTTRLRGLERCLRVYRGTNVGRFSNITRMNGPDKAGVKSTLDRHGLTDDIPYNVNVQRTIRTLILNVAPTKMYVDGLQAHCK